MPGFALACIAYAAMASKQTTPPKKTAHGSRAPGGAEIGAGLSARLRSLPAEAAALTPGDRWMTAVRAFAVLVLVAIPVFLVFYRGAPDPNRIAPYAEPFIPWTGGRIVWTVVIALLPLFIVSIGFYTWRRICPLAFFGRMSEWLQWPDRRDTPNASMRRKRVPKWLAVNYPIVTWSFLVAMLALRILLINSNALALALTFAGLCALAALCSFRYTGKTWCNFICPVGTIERIYTDADRPSYRQNSQCSKCTGCKTVPSGGLCPDINQENDYWQEIRQPARRWAFYSWPGAVFGFYLWYYLHKPYYWHTPGARPNVAATGLLPALPGTDWGYYLSGDWTRDTQPWREWLTPGWGFAGLPAPLDRVPTLVAAPLTLVVCALLSFAIFAAAEWLLRAYARRRGSDDEKAQEGLRHGLLSVAGFAGFVCFYQFAGAPTLLALPLGMYGVFRFGVTVCATTVLVTRLRRSRARQLQYDQARKWLQRWPLPQVAPPQDLEEAYRVVTEHLRTSEEGLRLYQNTLQGMLADNLLTAKEISLLDRMAEDLGLGDTDKKKVVRQLGTQYPGLFTGTLDEGLRLLGYRSELEQAISENRGALPDAGTLGVMLKRYRIQPDEHEAALRELRDPNSSRTENLRAEVQGHQKLEADADLLALASEPAISFLHYEIASRLADSRDHILGVANLYGTAGELTGLAAALRAGDPDARRRAGEWIQAHLPESLAPLVAAAAGAPATPPAPAGVEGTAAVPATATVENIANGRDDAEAGDTAGDRLARTLLHWSDDSDVVVSAAAVYGLCAVAAISPAVRVEAIACAERCLASADPLLHEAGSVAMGAMSAQRELPSPDQAAGGGRALSLLERVFALRALQLVGHLPSSALRHLAEDATEHVFRAGEALCEEGEASDAVYLIIEGETEAVRATATGELRLGQSGAGETVGEMGILDPAPRMATVRALTPQVRVLSLSGAEFRALFARDSRASLGIIRLLIRRQRIQAKLTG